MSTGGNETSAAASSRDARLLRYIRCFRIFAIFLTLIAAVSMGFSKQTKQSFTYNSLTGRSTYFSISVKATDSSSFVYFISANVFVFVCSVVLTVFSFIKKFSARLQLPVAIIDLVAVILLSTAHAAAAVTEEVAWKGNSHYGWDKFCNLTKNLCGIVIATTVISSLAAAIYFVMIVLSIVIIHRRSQY